MAVDIADESGTGGVESRRTLLKKLGIAGGALVWATPVVQTIMAQPAGAQPEPELGSPPPGPIGGTGPIGS